MNTDEIREEVKEKAHYMSYSYLLQALDEIDRLEKIEVWSLKAVKWLNEKDNEIAKIEQRTKEACIKEVEKFAMTYVWGPEGWIWQSLYKVMRELRTIDSAEIPQEKLST